MAYDSNIPLPQGATKLSEIAVDRDQPVTNLTKGASALVLAERTRLMSADALRRNNSMLTSLGQVFWNNFILTCSANQRGSNIIYKILQNEPGAARSIELVMTGAIEADADTASGTDTLLNITSHSQLQVGMYVFGTGIPAGTFIIAVLSPTSVQISQNATLTNSQQTLIWANKTSFDIVADTTASSVVLNGINSTLGMAAGQYITGPGIPANTTIATIASATSVTLSQQATITASAVALTGYQIIPATGYFLTLPIANKEILYYELDRDYILATTLGTGQVIIENGVNGGSSLTGRRLMSAPLSPTDGMPQLEMTTSGADPTFCLPLVSREDHLEGMTTLNPIIWIPHGIRWDMGFAGFLGQAFNPQTGVFPGVILDFGGDSAPAGYLMCDGSAVSRTTYAALYAVVGDRFGNGNGTTTFNVPKGQGMFRRGRDNGAAVDPDAATRTAMAPGGATGDNVGSIQADEFESHTHTLDNNGGFVYFSGPFTNSWQLPAGPNTTVFGTILVQATGGNETRPVNYYTNSIIKY